MEAGQVAPPRIVVLGGGGGVGRLLVPALRDTGARMLTQSRKAGPGIDWAAMPDWQMLTDWLRDWRPDLVVVLWGATAGSPQDLAANRTLSAMAYTAAAEAGCPAVAVMSSAAVYGPGAGTPLAETAPLAAASPYGLAKAEMEADLLRARSDLAQTAPALSLLRLANVVGADMLGRAVARASRTQPLLLDRFADGHGPRRSYLSPVTMARCCLALAASPPTGGAEVLNVADGPRPVAMDAVLEALDAAGMPVPWRWRAAPDGALASLALATDQLERRFPDLAQGFRRSAGALAADWIGLIRAAA
jgi:nucleoside-diphosphate-sugar epimerase